MSFMNIVYLLFYVYVIFVFSNFIWFIKLFYLRPFDETDKLLKFILVKQDQIIFSLVFMTFASLFCFNYIYNISGDYIHPIFPFMFIVSHILNALCLSFCSIYQQMLMDKLK
jgi:hypothetical protein